MRSGSRQAAEGLCARPQPKKRSRPLAAPTGQGYYFRVVRGTADEGSMQERPQDRAAQRQPSGCRRTLRQAAAEEEVAATGRSYGAR